MGIAVSLVERPVCVTSSFLTDTVSTSTMMSSRLFVVLTAVCLLQAFCVLSQEEEDGVIVADTIRLGQYIIQPQITTTRLGSRGSTASVGSTGVGGRSSSRATKVTWRITFYPITSIPTCSRLCRCAGYRYWAFSPSRRRCWCGN